MAAIEVTASGRRRRRGRRLGRRGGPAHGLVAAAAVSDLLNEAPRSRFHRRAVVISGMGFFTDAYDLFVIGTVAVLVKTQWHLSTTQTSWVTGSAILAAFFGALVFGRIADVLGRKSVYAAGRGHHDRRGAGLGAVAPGFLLLVVARFVLGLGIGGDYPVSAVLMSEYANRNDRGRLVGLVFSMQALVSSSGPLVGLILLVGRGPRPDLAAAARPGAVPGRRGRLPAGQDARVAPLPGAGPGRGRSRPPRAGSASPRGRCERRTTAATTDSHRMGLRSSCRPPHAASSSSARRAPGSSSTTPTTATPCRCRPS